MGKKVRIFADSVCDLPKDICEQRGIEILPLVVNLGEKSLHDMVDVTPDDIYDYYRSTKKLPTTSAPSPDDYRQIWEKTLSETDDEIVHFTLSKTMSCSHSSAVLQAEETNGRVFVIDSQNLSTGIALAVLYAQDLADQGASAKELVEKVNEMLPKVRASFVVCTTEFLWKGGRCSGIQALGANVLGIKPSIEVADGKMHPGKKYRGSFDKALSAYAEDILSGKTNLDYTRVFITHSGVDNEDILNKMKAKLQELQPNFKEIICNRAGCTISSHCGPNTLGILFVEK